MTPVAVCQKTLCTAAALRGLQWCRAHAPISELRASLATTQPRNASEA